MRHNFLTKKDFSWYHKIIIRTSLTQVVPEVDKTLRHLLTCITNKIHPRVSILSKDRGTVKINRSKDSVKSITRTINNLLRQTILALIFRWVFQMSMWVCLSNNNIRNKSYIKCHNNTVHKVMMTDQSTRVVNITSIYQTKRLTKILKK